VRRRQSWLRWCVRSAWCRVRERRQTVATGGGRAAARERVARVCFDRLKREREPRARMPPTGCATRTTTGGNAIWRHNSVETKSLNHGWWDGYLKLRFSPSYRRWGGNGGIIILSYTAMSMDNVVKGNWTRTLKSKNIVLQKTIKHF